MKRFNKQFLRIQKIRAQKWACNSALRAIGINTVRLGQSWPFCLLSKGIHPIQKILISVY